METPVGASVVPDDGCILGTPGPGLRTRSVIAHSCVSGSQCLHDDEDAVVDGR